MDVIEIVKLVLPGLPNFVGLIIGLLMLYRILNRLLDMIQEDDD